MILTSTSFVNIGATENNKKIAVLQLICAWFGCSVLMLMNMATKKDGAHPYVINFRLP